MLRLFAAQPLQQRHQAARQCLARNRELRRAAEAIANRCNPVIIALDKYMLAPENSDGERKYRVAQAAEPGCIRDCRNLMKLIEAHATVVDEILASSAE